MRINIYWVIIICPAFSVSNLCAQNISTDSILFTGAANKVIDYYNKDIAEQSEIYNGVIYEAPVKAYRGSVYFQDNNYYIPCLIRYDGILYKNIPVLYDIYSDVMAAASPNLFNYILHPEKASDVYLLNHHFIYVNAYNNFSLNPGYYDQLYDGKTTVLVKRIKTVNNNVTAQGVEVTYIDESEIYIKKGDKYLLVNGKSTVINILKDKKKELNQYLSSNKIRFNKDKEGSVARLARYYDQIIK
ncbi:MAG: hypothetical protein JWQ63_3536 [Mucilaginibacter sp.]|jgi:hypothetical protein|nr:hypothetical protein [Mucilaginibacter sp.]